MKNAKEHLLNEVLADKDYASFRRTLYSQGLAHLRRRRFECWGRQLLALAACGLIAAGLLFVLGPHAAAPRVATVLGEVVHSVPLTADQVVTDTGSEVEVVRTQLADLSPGRERSPYELVRTTNEPGDLEFISDGQLLELFPGQSLALVATSEGGKRLCFIDPKARALFLQEGSTNSL